MSHRGGGVALVAALLGLVLLAGQPASARAASSPGAGPVSPLSADPEERAGVRRPTTGALLVRLTGIRAGSAQITVTGPRGYTRRLTRGTTLRALRPGTYRVTARTVRLSSGTAAPARASRTVRVVRGRTASTTVKYLPPLPFTGVLTLKVSTPSGVPGTVRATGPGPALLSAKAPTGTAQTRSFRVKPGTWSVTPQPVSFAGTLYRAQPATVTVRRGATSTVTTTYAAAPAVRDVALTDLTTDSLTVAWTAPAAVDEVVVRIATGQTAPASRTDGAAVAVTGDEATATGLDPATVHSLSVFSRSGDDWLGPLTVQGSTDAPPGPADEPAAIFALAPGVWSPPAADAPPVTPRPDGRLDVVFPSPPHLGQPVVLPDSPELPGGFVGVVQQLGAGNLGVVGRAGLDRAYSYLDVDVPDLSALAPQLSPSGPAARGLRSAAAGLVECSGGTSASITATPTLNPYGHVSLVLASDRSWKGLSLGLDFDVLVGLTLDLQVTASVTGEVTCSPKALEPLNVPFTIGPVPMLFRAEPNLTLGASGTVSATAGATVSGGVSARGYLPVKSIGFTQARVDDADATGSAAFRDVEGEVEATLSAELGGRVDFGVGVGTPTGAPVDTGVLGGVTGSLTIARVAVTAKPTTDPAGCLETTAAWGGSFGLTARAWFEDYDSEASLPLLDWERNYPGTPIFRPESCAPKVWSGTESWTAETSSTFGRNFTAHFTRRWLVDGGQTFVEEFGNSEAGYGTCTERQAPVSGGPERTAVDEDHVLRYDDWNGLLTTPQWNRRGWFVFGFGYSPPSGWRVSGCEEREYTGVDLCYQDLTLGRLCGAVLADPLPPPDGNTFVFERTVSCDPDLCPTASWGEEYSGTLTLKIRLTGEKDSDGDGLPDSTDPDPSTPNDP